MFKILIWTIIVSRPIYLSTDKYYILLFKWHFMFLKSSYKSKQFGMFISLKENYSISVVRSQNKIW